MPENQSSSSGPSLLPVERPRCPRCQNRMALAQILPGPPGFDLRKFECDNCDHIVTLTVATDPMKSDKVGWLAGELKPPE
jgi:predicted  nucleic acid-binding Zn ribbon protein